jgi:hypothetical protein
MAWAGMICLQPVLTSNRSPAPGKILKLMTQLRTDNFFSPLILFFQLLFQADPPKSLKLF